MALVRRLRMHRENEIAVERAEQILRIAPRRHLEPQIPKGFKNDSMLDHGISVALTALRT